MSSLFTHLFEIKYKHLPSTRAGLSNMNHMYPEKQTYLVHYQNSLTALKEKQNEEERL